MESSMASAGPAARRITGPRALINRIWESRWCYVFMAPALVLIALFTLYPIAASWYFSFTEWSGFLAEPEFIGLANYAEVVQDNLFWNAFRNSFLFIAISVPIKMALGLILAIILNDKALRLAALFRTMFFIPVVTTTAIIGIVMTFILSPFNGPINMIFMDLGLISRPIDFLGNPNTVLPTLALVEAWKWLGNPLIYWLAALQTIPTIYYEAAQVDGANWWQQFVHVTFPLLRPFAIVILLIVSVNTLNIFALVQSMTGGGPFFASEVMEVYIYRTAFGSAQSATLPRIGYASAAAVFFGVSVMFFAVFQTFAGRYLSRTRGEFGTQE